MEKINYSRDEVAVILGISTDTVDALANRGIIRRTKIGSRTLFQRDEIIRFTEKLKREGSIRYAK